MKGISAYLREAVGSDELKPADTFQSEVNGLLNPFGLQTGTPYGRPKSVEGQFRKGVNIDWTIVRSENKDQVEGYLTFFATKEGQHPEGGAGQSPERPRY